MPSHWHEGWPGRSLEGLCCYEAVLELCRDDSGEALAGDVASERFERERFCWGHCVCVWIAGRKNGRNDRRAQFEDCMLRMPTFVIACDCGTAV